MLELPNISVQDQRIVTSAFDYVQRKKTRQAAIFTRDAPLIEAMVDLYGQVDDRMRNVLDRVTPYLVYRGRDSLSAQEVDLKTCYEAS